jgi:hypothetical protein
MFSQINNAFAQGLDAHLQVCVCGWVRGGWGGVRREGGAHEARHLMQSAPAVKGCRSASKRSPPISPMRTRTPVRTRLQAQKAALSEPAALSQQLRESLGSAASLAETLRQSQQLMRTASSASAGAATSTPRSPSTRDPRAELSALLAQGRLEEAFSAALSVSDLSLVAWLCAQVAPSAVFGQDQAPLSQLVILSLLQQLAADLTPGPPGALTTKLQWIMDAGLQLDTKDPVISGAARQVGACWLCGHGCGR